jgi:hypothetical protein
MQSNIRHLYLAIVGTIHSPLHIINVFKADKCSKSIASLYRVDANNWAFLFKSLAYVSIASLLRQTSDKECSDLWPGTSTRVARVAPIVLHMSFPFISPFVLPTSTSAPAAAAVRGAASASLPTFSSSPRALPLAAGTITSLRTTPACMTWTAGCSIRAKEIQRIRYHVPRRISQ